MNRPNRICFVSKTVSGGLKHGWQLYTYEHSIISQSEFYSSEMIMFRNVIETFKQDLRYESKIIIDANPIAREVLLKASSELYPDLAENLRNEGLEVVVVDDWKDRSQGEWTSIESGMH